jgi:F-type H+-transporting ATPase subunit a
MADPAAHVIDTTEIHLPFGYHFEVPQPFEALGINFHMTKFMWLEVVAAVLMLLIFVPLAWRVRNGVPPKGRLWNMFEVILVFLRDQVVRPAIGHHEADRFLPFVWTIFFFILFCNLLGLLPWSGSPTGALGVTATLAGITFAMVLASGMQKYGLVRFWLGLVPHMELPLLLAVFLVPLIWVIELLSLLIKHVILSVRLLANMFAGHLVLAVVIGFIADLAGTYWWWGVTPMSIFGAVCLNMLELFVAFLQAYIFAFLASLFIGMAVHQH